MNRKKSKKLYFIRGFILFLFFLTTSVYLFWRFRYTIPLQFGWLSIIAGSILFIAELEGFFESSIFYYTLWDKEPEKVPEYDWRVCPEVDIFVATYNEPEELIYKTIVGCKNMHYPDRDKVHIHICDDGRRASMQALAKSMGVNYITRNTNEHAKAGNLNNALSKTNAPYVVTFDADMIPMHDFLLVTIPYFFTTEKVGFVQVPQNFYNPDLFQYNLFTEEDMPNEQDLFSRSIQAGKGKHNAVIYAGSNTVLSRAALEEIGGLVTGTITEDFATGMKIQSRGYQSKYLNEIHASGLAPETLEDLFNQRIRWARGVIQTFKTFNPMRMKGLKLKQKLLYLSTFSYWYFGLWRLVFFLAPILFSLFGIVVLNAEALTMFMIWVPMFFFTNLTFRYFTNNVRGVSWSHIYDTILFPQILAGVLKETFGIRMSKFKVTPKENVKRDSYIQRFELIWVQIILMILTLLSIGRLGFLFVTDQFQIQYVINFFWLLYNLYVFIMTLFFASERPKFRNAQRISAKESVRIKYGKKEYKGQSIDLSENSITLLLKQALYFKEEQEYPLEIETPAYKANLYGKIVRVDSINGHYKYIFTIRESSSEDKDAFLMIVYDRVPSFPREQKSRKLGKIIVRNMSKRSKEFIPFNRKLPRIPLNKKIRIILNGKIRSVFALDFNYEYLSLKEKLPGKQFFWKPDESKKIKLEFRYDEEMTKRMNRNVFFYQVLNYNEKMGPIY